MIRIYKGNIPAHVLLVFNSLHSWNWFMIFLLSSFWFLSILTFKKKLSGIPPECQMIWIQVRPDVLSGLIPDQAWFFYHTWSWSELFGNQQSTSSEKEYLFFLHQQNLHLHLLQNKTIIQYVFTILQYTL